MTVIPSTHNIRRPAFWLFLTCVVAVGFFLVTDPRAGWLKYGGVNAVDAQNNAEVGTIIGIAGAGLIGVVAMFLCTRKGTPRTK